MVGMHMSELAVMKTEGADNGIMIAVEVDTDMSCFLFFMNEAVDAFGGVKCVFVVHIRFEMRLYIINMRGI